MHIGRHNGNFENDNGNETVLDQSPVIENDTLSNENGYTKIVSSRSIERRNLRSIATGEIYADDPQSPQLAWLMSFPNSGSTFTMSMIQQVTETTTANVYGSYSFSKEKQKIYKNVVSSKPVYEDKQSGPYLFSDYDIPKSPNSFIATKTHCTGFCYDCPPQRYVKNRDDFFQGCRTGEKVVIHNDEDQNNEPIIQEEIHQHDPALIKRAVHLIRNPLDNIVARFHYVWKVGSTHAIPDVRDRFTFDKDGFHRYCNYLDKKYSESVSQWYTPMQLKSAMKVPCHSEFYKYIQWHNLSFRTTKEILQNIPEMVIIYEDYEHHLDETTDRLLKFLGLTKLNDPPFFDFHRYPFFSEEEKHDMYLFMKILASDETWSFMELYCRDDLGDEQLCRFPELENSM